MSRNLRDVLYDEMLHKRTGGIYHKLQVDFAFNSNHIEGSKLTHDQTRYIYETRTIDTFGVDAVSVDDVLETVNHFKCFDFLMKTLDEPISEDFIKELHVILKSGIDFAQNMDAVIGDYKRFANYVGEITTASPKEVPNKMQKLIGSQEKSMCFYEILDFHASFEKIHPFYDGNGRIGRLLMFKQCLNNDIVPFIVSDQNKMFYYRGMKEWQTGGQKGYLIDTCLSLQDDMKSILNYFEIEYDKSFVSARDVIKEYHQKQNKGLGL